MKKNKISEGSRFKEVLSILIKHDLIKGLDPYKLRAIIEDLGPTFIKFGQIMSLRSDMIPADFCAELKKLQTEVKPMKYDQVTEVIESSLGRSMGDLFSYFEGKPLGSASIAQVHKAKLHSGEWVVVKVQRQGVRHTMERDIKLLKKSYRCFEDSAWC
ncbi:AarF/ABC1/UbiB kinase family protein [Acidaminobacter sp. JC074]|uniref:AarF/UbiB family protein n=1 Tax=Acidaminobacter sp. JC074 TaxID=2530199 RepID=UPI0021026A6C|nr:AarF/UbiB family protein [Acidaminobacter sp. JC074]MCH4887784.1 AarF/ABC1/UbiB kinase family protein [Acidaminobacter sp. JC074]